MNTTIYDVEFPDGEIREYGSNVIAENMYFQVDAEGYRYQLLCNIVDHKPDGNSIHPNNLYINTKSGHKRMRQTTSGWNLLVQWNNGTQEWVPLKKLNNSNPIEVAELSVAQSIEKGTFFHSVGSLYITPS